MVHAAGDGSYFGGGAGACAGVSRACDASAAWRGLGSFDWADSRRVREAGTNAWRDLGAGIDLTAYEAEKVKAALTETLGGIRVAVKIPRTVWEAAGERLIDKDEAAFSGLALR